MAAAEEETESEGHLQTSIQIGASVGKTSCVYALHS